MTSLLRNLLLPIVLLSLAGVGASASAVDAGGPEAGDRAPAFALRDQHGTLRRNADYSGRWLVLYFYPRSFTTGCTEQVCAFRDDIHRLREAGARVVGVSLDKVESQQAFAEKYQVPFPLLSDASHVAARSYGVLAQRNGSDYARRETFLIDAAGVVVKRYRDVDPQDNVQQVLADIAAETARSARR